MVMLIGPVSSGARRFPACCLYMIAWAKTAVCILGVHKLSHGPWSMERYSVDTSLGISPARLQSRHWRLRGMILGQSLIAVHDFLTWCSQLGLIEE